MPGRRNGGALLRERKGFFLGRGREDVSDGVNFLVKKAQSRLLFFGGEDPFLAEHLVGLGWVSGTRAPFFFFVGGGEDLNASD